MKLYWKQIKILQWACFDLLAEFYQILSSYNRYLKIRLKSTNKIVKYYNGKRKN